MQSSAIYAAIEKIAKVPSKNEKIALLTEHLTDLDFLSVVQYAYNTLIIFGVGSKTIREIEAKATFGQEEFGPQTLDLLMNLASRNLTGTEAEDAILAEFNRLNKASATLLRRILLKDLRAGFGDTSINKARKGTVPVFPYMRCSLPKDSNFDKWDWRLGALSQEKADGMFANVNVLENGMVVVSSRQGSAFDEDSLGALPGLLSMSLQPGTQTHGELLVYRDGKALPREESNGIMNHLLSGGSIPDGHDLVFLAWDQIPLSAVQPKGQYTVPYAKRFSLLQAQLVADRGPVANAYVRLIPTRIVRSKAEAWAHFGELLKQGKEGTIVKSPTAIWKDGTSKDQVKLKLEFEVELRIEGFEPGEGKNESTFGSLLCRSECGLLKTAVSGFSDSLRQEIHDNREEWLDGVITVRANGIMQTEGQPAALFLPRFAQRRLDKSVADTLAQIIAIRDATIEAA